MITALFGSPGCGKSSVLTVIAQKERKRIAKGKSKYKRVYTNFPCRGCASVDYKSLGKYYYNDCLILLDELTLDADSRDWKDFPEETKRFVTLHRHFGVDIIYAVQDWSRAEKTIRQNTVGLYYLSRFLGVFAIARPIYRTININEYVSELIQGYRFPSWREALHGTKVFYIKKAWRYYDSFEKYGFDKKPEPQYKVW